MDLQLSGKRARRPVRVLQSVCDEVSKWQRKKHGTSAGRNANNQFHKGRHDITGSVHYRGIPWVRSRNRPVWRFSVATTSLRPFVDPRPTGRIDRPEYVVFIRTGADRIEFIREYFDPTRTARALDTPILDLEPWW